MYGATLFYYRLEHSLPIKIHSNNFIVKTSKIIAEERCSRQEHQQARHGEQGGREEEGLFFKCFVGFCPNFHLKHV